MSRQYPYIQDKKKITNFICETCRQKIKKGYRIEWRVDWFQGNCEFENTCTVCLNKEMQRLENSRKTQAEIEQRRHDRYVETVKPRWDLLKKMLDENNVEVKKYPHTGQWVFNNVLDWWTTTGTAINRKTKKRYRLSVEKPQEIIQAIHAS